MWMEIGKREKSFVPCLDRDKKIFKRKEGELEEQECALNFKKGIRPSRNVQLGIVCAPACLEGLI